MLSALVTLITLVRPQSRDPTRSAKARDLLPNLRARSIPHPRMRSPGCTRRFRYGGADSSSGCGGEVTRSGGARWTEWALRLSLATAFLSAVGDRLGAI